MIVKIVCPKCETEGGFSLADAAYEGPYRCWKCRELFAIRMEDNELKSCQPITEEDLEKQQELQKLRNRFQR